MILYHLTWDCHVESILKHGLKPNHRPNDWWEGLRGVPQERSKGKTFLCKSSRMDYWIDVYEGDYAGTPEGAAALVWLKVRCKRINMTQDEGEDGHEKDFWTTEHIPPDRITVHQLLPFDRHLTGG